MKTQCPHCNTKFRLPNEYVGKKVKCPKCSEELQAPETKKDNKQRIMRTRSTIIVLVFIVSAFLVYVHVFRPNVRFTIREVHLGDVSPTVIISPDGNRVATIKRQHRGMQVVVDGKESEEYDIVSCAYLPIELFEFSPDSQRFAYTAKIGTKEFIVVDGTKQEIERRLEDFAFSPDGSRYAYITADKNGGHIFVDGVKEMAPKASYYYGLTFSPDANRLVYGVATKQKYDAGPVTIEAKEYKVVLDGVVERESRCPMGNFVFSADSKRFAYKVTNKSESFVVVDGMEGDKYDAVFSLQFLPASGQLAYMAARSRKFFMVIDRVKGSDYDNIGEGGPVFSPNGKRVAYAAKRRHKWLMVVDGVESDEFDRVSEAVFSPNSQRVMFTAMRDGKHYVVVDDVAGTGYDEVGGLTFSPDSKRIAYVARRGKKWLAVVDSTEHKECERINFLVFSPDSQRVAFSANVGFKLVELQEGEYEIQKVPTRVKLDSFGFPDFEYTEDRVPNAKGMERIKKAAGKWFVNIDGVETKKYDMVANGTFSPDGKHFLYWAQKDDKWVIVINGQQCAEYDSFVRDSKRTFELYFSSGKFVFDSPTTFHTLAIRDNEVLRLEVEIVR